MRSATMMVVTFVATDGISGMMDASAMRRLSIPRTLPQASTTAVGSESAPIGTVEVGCRYEAILATMFVRRPSPSSMAHANQRFFEIQGTL